jgi:hypothetical protein
MFDSESKTWDWDTETENAKFPDGTIWDDSKKEWYRGYLGDGGYDPLDERIAAYFPVVLDTLNTLHAQSEA